jgi:hypothetical protein
MAQSVMLWQRKGKRSHQRVAIPRLFVVPLPLLMFILILILYFDSNFILPRLMPVLVQNMLDFSRFKKYYKH